MCLGCKFCLLLCVNSNVLLYHSLPPSLPSLPPSVVFCQGPLWKVSLCTVGLSLCSYWQVQLTAVGSGACVPVGRLFPFTLQVHKCPSQATYVHSLTCQVIMIRISAQSAMNFGHVRLKKDPVMTVALLLVDCMDGKVIPIPLWCWTFPKDGVLVVWR